MMRHRSLGDGRGWSGFRCLGLAVLVLLGGRSAVAVEPAAPDDAFVSEHCTSCHNDVSRKGQLDLTGLEFEASDPANRAMWIKVHDRVKAGEMPPFQTRGEIESKIARGGLTKAEISDLWNSLYLTLPEIETLLDHVRDTALHDWIHPMVATAAHTGARRSELIRMRVSDVDFARRTIIVREKKRKHGVNSTRRVPLSPFLANVLREWIDRHAGGSDLFCHTEVVKRSKKRSRTTGHNSGENRATTTRGWLEAVREREARFFEPLTADEAHDHLRRTLACSAWAVLHGWHVLRHSFISACASKGIDQRMIQAWCGHMTPEMSARYTHLYPTVQQEAIQSVFG